MSEKATASMDEAIELHASAAAVAGNEAMSALLESVGAIKAADMMGNLLDGLHLAMIRRVRESKTYRLLPSSSGQGRCTWEEFCAERLGISRRTVEETMLTEDRLGQGFCAAAERIGIRRSDVRMLLAAPGSLQGEVRDVVENIEEAGEAELRKTVDTLLERLSDAEERLERHTEDSAARLAAKDAEIANRKKVLGRAESTIYACEQQIRELKAEWSPKDDEVEATTEIAMQEATIRSALRKATEQAVAMIDSHQVASQLTGLTESLVEMAETARDALLAALKEKERREREG